MLIINNCQENLMKIMPKKIFLLYYDSLHFSQKEIEFHVKVPHVD
jgi:hypothetical protein